tara:strand:+ start:224 stop:766 length:543 start_codon:yes stop_codon:yes gene_type:complete
MQDKNTGQNGLDSLRINGRKLDNLPLGQGEKAKQGLSDFLRTDKETKENNVKAKYPKVNQDYCRGSLKETNNNIKRIKEMKAGLKVKTTEYSQLIKDSYKRDAEIESCKAQFPDDTQKIKDLMKQYLPYNIEALETQIKQFEESIERCNSVIEQEFTSIAELTRVLALVQQRDLELRNIK